MGSRRKVNLTKRDDAGSQPAPEQSYIIQVSGREPTFSMEEALALLGTVGVTLDQGYGPISVNRDRGQFVLRGRATEKTRQQVERLIPEVRFFGDSRIRPTSPPLFGSG